MKHVLMVYDTSQKEFIYKERIHSQQEYIGRLFDLVQELEDYPTTEILYFAPQPEIGHSRSHRFPHSEIMELANMIKKAGTK